LALALPAAGELRLRPPLVWQERGGERAPVPCRYLVHGGEVRFDLRPHDPALGLTIDPVVTFATLRGGSGPAVTSDVAVERGGYMSITGSPTSTVCPLRSALPTPSAPTLGFVTMFDPSGALVFSTYFGGAGGTTTPVDLGMDL